jgi:imidazolonepropionase-like amidohydrolase
MLALGVTTGRSMLTLNFTDAGLGALHERGDEDVPTILAAGYPVVAYPVLFQPDLTSIFLQHAELDHLRRQERIGAEGARQIVQANAGHRVQWIKVFANERAGVPATDPATRNLSDEELTAAVAEARRLGLPAAAHAYSDDGVAAAVRAGVKTVEHGALVSEPTLRLMKERDVCFTPTLSGFYEMTQPKPNATAEEQGLQQRGKMLLEHLQKALATGRRLGVKVLAGTDTGYGEGEPTLLDEIEHLAQNGLPPAETLRAATATSAECLGLTSRKGALRAGVEADLVAYRLDPRNDLRALRSPLLVVNGGRVFLNKLGQ